MVHHPDFRNIHQCTLHSSYKKYNKLFLLTWEGTYYFYNHKVILNSNEPTNEQINK